MVKHRKPYTTMARLLNVSTCGYYAWLVREPSKQACSDAQLLSRIHTLHASSRGVSAREPPLLSERR
ncbi:MAG TPA: hypothetical protein VJS30_15275 [Paraburkholderia sp.]|nr:hypothetical protein [Gemmatimonadaceae bacterium]HKT97874.1 hypothetical protein [Paraburkholderia sp.]